MMSPGPVKTTCPYCGVGCGVLARRHGTNTGIAGDPGHPANFGSLCSKGSALGDTVSLEDRLLYPLVDGRQASWDEALGRVAQAFSETIERHGPDSVAFYVSGQLLTEDYYIANKLMKGFIGSANIDTNSRLCMSSAVAGHKRAFGGDLVPGCYEDLTLADLIVLTGSNTAWCHPILFRRIVQEKERRPELKLVVIDPRRTATAEIADLHLPVRSGTDVWLFNGLLTWLRQHRAIDAGFVSAHTCDAGAALDAAEASTPDTQAVAQACGIDVARLEEFYRLFATTERVVTAFSQGVNQSSSGTDKVNSILNCHLLTGRIGRPGMGPFSLTGQPNAMGGREVGGMANMLAAHMDLADPSHRAPGAAVLAQPADGHPPRPQGRRPVRGRALRPDQGAVDHGDQSGGELAGRRPGQSRPEKMRLCRGVRLRGSHRHDSTGARAPACGCLGRERWNGDEFGAPHLAAARLYAASG